jgi:hypothetical protein
VKIFVLLLMKTVVSQKKARKNVVQASNVSGPRTFLVPLANANKSAAPSVPLTTKNVVSQKKAKKFVVEITNVMWILPSLELLESAELPLKSNSKRASMQAFAPTMVKNAGLHGKVKKNVVLAPNVCTLATPWVHLECVSRKL